MGAAKRVLVGQMWQEAHGFTPLTTSLDAFAVDLGEDVVSRNADADSVLGGIIRVGRQQEWVLIPTIAARASPGGRVTDSAYTFIKETILQCAKEGGFDAIALCLHGCMQTESLDSAEADLLIALRRVVGSDIPIVAGFDLHAHASGGMLQHLDFASAYKTNPHADAGTTGERVGRVLARMLTTGERPSGAMVTVPMLTRGNDETGSGPLQELHRAAKDETDSSEDLIDASIFNVNPFIDGVGVGQTVAVYAWGPGGRASATALAEKLALGLWNQRDLFQMRLPSLSGTLAEEKCRVVVGDFGDRVLAGGPGDSIFVVQTCQLEAPEMKVVAPVTDPAAVEACTQAGIGAEVTLRVGGAFTPGGQSIEVRGVVRAIGADGYYRNRGAFMKGAILRVGSFAVLKAANVTLLITKSPLMSQDPGCFLDCGIDLHPTDVIVVKSGYHFKLGFGEYGACICADTPGLTRYEPTAENFRKARPLYPLDDIDFAPLAQRTRN